MEQAHSPVKQTAFPVQSSTGVTPASEQTLPLQERNRSWSRSSDKRPNPSNCAANWISRLSDSLVRQSAQAALANSERYSG